MKKTNNIKDFLFANNKQYIVERENLIDELGNKISINEYDSCLLYTSPSPRDRTRSRMPSSA
jgi:hypothetical protein